jgi:hypothetical protein
VSLAVVSTMRTLALAPLRSWLRYHRALGFERFYLFFDPGDPGIPEASATEGVEVVIVDDAYRARLAEHPWARRHARLLFETGAVITSPDAFTALQLSNMAVGLDLARRDGARWLLHIDLDELFHPGDMTATAHFQLLDALAVGQARYINHEAIPALEEHDDYFADLTLFKRNPAEVPAEIFDPLRPFWERRQGYFLAYANGKCAVRTLDGVTPATAHGFRLPVVPLGRVSLSTPCILHYPYASFDRYWAKHARLGDFRGDAMLGERWDPPEFLLAARDFVRGDQREEARRRYLQTVLLDDPQRITELLELGVLIRVERPAKLLAGRS